MKELQLTLSEHDQLNALLFSMSKSPQIIKARKRSRILFILLMLILAIPFFYYEPLLAILIIVVSVVAFLFFPKYLGIYYKRYFSKYVKSPEFQNRIGIPHTITFEDNYLQIKSTQMESKYQYDQFEYMTETAFAFFIKLKMADQLFFPKQQIKDTAEFKAFLTELSQRLHIAYQEELDWRWK
ncbi:YcxB family protein [Sphingobacterium athyrii]|uniref:YcxB-like C-terminal domain-containing protein n=1 Tax=Sphingobacterium athyrii TaxID=2152717 RepID=A0A363NRD8_9SPHI|nr:YcxB family protein [Sphingobacterium athyrii]PUV23375.1 hypothetical protein DCO56_15715 [Sphingobacterium athyrii]